MYQLNNYNFLNFVSNLDIDSVLTYMHRYPKSRSKILQPSYTPT